MFFCKMGLTKLRSIFGAFFVPTWLHSASQDPPKTLQKPTPRCIKILIDFYIVFFTFWAPFWEPSWGHVGHFFGQKGGGAVKSQPLLCWVFVIFRFLDRLGPILAPFWLHFGASGRNLASILEVLGPIWVPSWRYFGPF